MKDLVTSYRTGVDVMHLSGRLASGDMQRAADNAWTGRVAALRPVCTGRRAETLNPRVLEGLASSSQAPAMPIMATMSPANRTKAEAA
jgi:hypothetical protein